MKYLPNLIPEDKRVLPDYFRSNPYKYNKGNPALNVLGYIVGFAFIILAFANINHILQALLYACVGFILLPLGHKFLESMFSFRLTTKIKTVLCLLLLVISVPFQRHYRSLDIENEKILKEKQIALEKVNAEEKRRSEARQDSFNFYYSKILLSEKENKTDEAQLMIQSASVFASSTEEKERLEGEVKNLNKIKVLLLVKDGKHNIALPILSSLLQANPQDTELLCVRAKCLHRIGKTQAAVDDLKAAISYGSVEAQRLHDKINPIRKRVSYYTTLCCDGTTSSATGRGACSWHGGVCDWNHPIYEEYRKYE